MNFSSWQPISSCLCFIRLIGHTDQKSFCLTMESACFSTYSGTMASFLQNFSIYPTPFLALEAQIAFVHFSLSHSHDLLAFIGEVV